ncbi:MAG: methionyl-tRNA formyltransferase [Planctomycetes bacterium]|nr:methionyl-tRNA formyltransferase [Planctomycetota bacterium]MDP6424626.1 methionyl-tRNA formyltransferase [Planctomycetota bacterium]
MKTVFLGTDDFPVPSLHALAESDHRPALVATKPDGPRGRGRKIYPQKVRLVAEELGFPCEQPADVLAPEFMDRLRKLAPDVIIVVSFGRILTEEFLAIPAKYCINAHASLLPSFRGASPVPHAILAGDRVTGITIQKIEVALDTGPILTTVETEIEKHENTGALFNRLAVLSGKALVQGLDLIASGKGELRPQDEAKATLAPKLVKENGFIDWENAAEEIDRLVRGYTPKPGSRTRFGPRKLIVMEGRVEDDNFGLGMPGGVMTAGEEGIRVCTGRGIFRVLRLKPENGRNMTAGEFVRGHQFPPDARFG